MACEDDQCHHRWYRYPSTTSNGVKKYDEVTLTEWSLPDGTGKAAAGGMNAAQKASALDEITKKLGKREKEGKRIRDCRPHSVPLESGDCYCPISATPPELSDPGWTPIPKPGEEVQLQTEFEHGGTKYKIHFKIPEQTLDAKAYCKVWDEEIVFRGEDEFVLLNVKRDERGLAAGA